MKQLSVLGSTGSIGRNTLEIVKRFPDRFHVRALAAKTSTALLARQIGQFRPDLAVVIDAARAAELSGLLGADSRVEILYGDDGYAAAATHGAVDTVVAAMVGAAGLKPTLAAIDAHKDIALANKETLVMAGEIVIARAAQKKVRILPVDSEHSAIFQCLCGHRREDLDRILLTASGGPFLKRPRDTFAGITPTEALDHPTWQMGPKISIDSATLMNKGLEVIEAQHLFDVPSDRIDVLVHPQSIVHSMVSYVDGSVIAQLGIPDMKAAIAYALAYPERLALKQPLPDFAGMGALVFEHLPAGKFACLDLAYVAGRTGGTLPAVMNAANEVAVYGFLDRRIAFVDIPVLIDKTMTAHRVIVRPGIEDILDADRWARAHTEAAIGMLSG